MKMQPRGAERKASERILYISHATWRVLRDVCSSARAEYEGYAASGDLAE